MLVRQDPTVTPDVGQGSPFHNPFSSPFTRSTFPAPSPPPGLPSLVPPSPSSLGQGERETQRGEGKGLTVDVLLQLGELLWAERGPLLAIGHGAVLLVPLYACKTEESRRSHQAAREKQELR